ncbi:homocysteine S-methyltransferase family protein [Solirubrobacter ginsenosidimutans]|uniref:Homocysteine S-methyltransferase family protein n=1 Tax=Solirubrobacter ginsenosidimutans TaxID=490573 RepID=A0A9X3MUC8_9ACTN|nr:homocysteine S-methyltransferase family protein [Solirubrobacter ginsenosidimutans]MDA0162567.1 homocysteine S-methyltransferase family protein [Solirubrobacter ginsenosidimutans]
MSYRDHLPQLDGQAFLTDGGIETVLIFHEGFELPAFAAFDLLKDDYGTAALRRYYAPFVELAASRGLGFIAESPTWRASSRWGQQLGYSASELALANRRAIALMEELRSIHPLVVISGCVGPSDDGYDPAQLLSADEAEAYHAIQIGTFAETAADMVTAITMTYAEEAIGVVRAARQAGLPVVVSFTVETDGRLPSGQSLAEALAQVDGETDASPAYYMLNCAHPTHFEAVLEDASVRERVRGLRANASRLSHAELDEAAELDAGDPDDLAARYASLRDALPHLTVLGGCCGTDLRHVTAIAGAI